MYFSTLVGSAANRTAFSAQLAAFAKEYEFDGVDLGEESCYLHRWAC